MLKVNDKISPPSYQEYKKSPRKHNVNGMLLGELGDLQGYRFGKSMSCEDLSAWIDARLRS
jgi:hypothetical protein